jgi:hypothetical protein
MFLFIPLSIYTVLTPFGCNSVIPLYAPCLFHSHALHYIPSFLKVIELQFCVCVFFSQLLSQLADFWETWYDNFIIRGHLKAARSNLRNENNTADSAALTPSA